MRTGSDVCTMESGISPIGFSAPESIGKESLWDAVQKHVRGEG